jgi:hypothetical protein
MEGTMKGKAARAYLEGFGTLNSLLELDALTAQQVIEALARSGRTRFSTPGSGAGNAGIRSAMGH